MQFDSIERSCRVPVEKDYRGLPMQILLWPNNLL